MLVLGHRYYDNIGVTENMVTVLEVARLRNYVKVGGETRMKILLRDNGANRSAWILKFGIRKMTA